MGSSLKKYLFGMFRKLYYTPFLYLAFPMNTVLAQINYSIPNPSKYGSLEQIISAAASLIRPVFLITFGAMLLFGAITWGTAGTSTEKVEQAKKILAAAIIGFALAVFAPTIMGFVLDMLGVEGFGSGEF